MSSDIKQFTNFRKRKQNLVCITGAGISTASGIPDYRGINGSYSRGHRPIQHHEFVTHEKFRKRYWVRSMGGYKHLKDAKPNLGHESLVKLFHLGIVKKIITQNVDNLHAIAATTAASNPIPIINLHGVIHEIRCLSCHEISSRNNFQNSLETLNPDIADMLKTADHGSESVRADGDMNIENVDLTKVTLLPSLMPICPFSFPFSFRCHHVHLATLEC
jgi:NAD+-dependent protein deacetylase sirtuin 4